MIDKYWGELVSMCEYEHYPFEKPLHNIFKKELCISPIPTLSIHCTNINQRYDTFSHVLFYPQKPLINTKMMKYFTFLAVL